MRGTDWHSQFLSLLVVAGLSFGAGLSLGWAIWQNHAADSHIAANDAPASEAPPPSVAPIDKPVAPAASLQAAPEVKNPEGAWPARHLFVAVQGQWLSEGTKAFLRELKPGGVVLRAENLANSSQTLALVRELKQTVGLGHQQFTDLPLVAIEIDGGTRNGIGLAGAPDAATMGASGNAELTRQEGLHLAQACVERGISIVFGPVLDVYEPGAAMTSLATQAFGAEPAVVRSMGLAFAQGMMDGGVIAAAGHFPGYGAATYSPGGYSLVVSKDVTGLAETMFPFNEAVNQGVLGMIVGHVAVPVLDKGAPDRLASMSPLLVDTILRQRWGFSGVIISDDISTTQLLGDITQGEAAVRAMQAGCDAVLLLDSDESRIRAVCDAIAQAAAEGRLSTQNLDASKRRLDAWQTWLDRAGRTETSAPQPPISSTPADTLVARSIPAAEPPRETPLQTPINQAKSQPAFTTPVDALPEPALAVTSPEPETAAVPESENIEPVTTDSPAVLTQDPPLATPEPADVTAEENETPIESPVVTSLADPRVDVQPSATVEEPITEPATDATTVDDGAEPPQAPSEAPVETDSTGRDQAALVPDSPAESVETAADTSKEADAAAADAIVETPVVKEPVVENVEAPGESVEDLPETKHLVETGDTLSGIASRYGVTMADITRWNNLKDSSVKLGAKLVIHPKSNDQPAADVQPTSSPEPVANTEPAPEGEPSAAPPNADELTTYKVQAGDTLMRIAGRFNTTPEKILSLNGLGDPNHVVLGQTLKVPR